MCFSICIAIRLQAQQPFKEGRITYHIKLVGVDRNVFEGSYVFTFKENNLKKELVLANYHEIMLINIAKTSVYTLKNVNNKKFAIQLSLADIQQTEMPYTDFKLEERVGKAKKIAGLPALRGSVDYKNGSSSDIYFSKEWYPEIPYAFERFPNAKFLPVSFSYREADGSLMEFTLEQIITTEVDNSNFVIPRDYKLITNDEYKNMR